MVKQRKSGVHLPFSTFKMSQSRILQVARNIITANSISVNFYKEYSKTLPVDKSVIFQHGSSIVQRFVDVMWVRLCLMPLYKLQNLFQTSGSIHHLSSSAGLQHGGQTGSEGRAHRPEWNSPHRRHSGSRGAGRP